MIDQNLITNEDYQDFRELICYERPASVLLHFNHGLLGLRLLLVDRILLKTENDRIIGQSNYFADFLNSYNVLADTRISTKTVNDFEQDLRQEFENKSTNALLLTYGNVLAGELLLSTWMVEYNIDNKVSPWLVSSLRGDDFYIRRPMTTEEIYDKSYKSDNATEIQSLSFSKDILSLAQLSLDDFSKAFKVEEAIHEVSQKLSETRLNGSPAGSEILIAKTTESRPQHDDLINKVTDGFKNILLVRYFWPIQFHFKPFIIFLNQYLKINNFNDSFLINEINSIKTETEILNGLSAKYGINPQSKTLDQFYQYFLSILNRVQGVENHFFSNYPSQKMTYSIESSGSFGNALAPMLEYNGLHLSSKSAMVPTLHLSDKTAIDDPNSGYIDKLNVRKKLSNSVFSVVHKEISSSSDLENLEYPFILKSSLGWGSGYVFKVSNAKEAQQSIIQIKNLNRIFHSQNPKAKIFAEEFLTGQEFAAEIKINAQGAEVLSIFERIENEENKFLDHAYVLIRSRQKLLKNQFSNLLIKICQKLQITSPFAHIEFKWDEKIGRFGLVEVNFRMGGGGFLANVYNYAFSNDIFSAESNAETYHKEMDNDIFLGLIPIVKGKGLIREIKGKKEIMEMKCIKKAFWLKNEGSYFSPPPLGFDYAAGIISSHKNLDEMNKYICEIEQILEFIYA